MTSNQIAYWANKEKERHNKQQERLDAEGHANTRRGQDLTYQASKYSTDKKKEAQDYATDEKFKGDFMKAFADIIPL